MEKCSSTQEKLEVLRRHSSDEVFISKVISTFPHINMGREIEALYYILNFFGNKEIGEKLFLTEQTIKFHNTSIFKKAGVKNRRQVLAKFYQMPGNIEVRRRHRVEKPPEPVPDPIEQETVLPFSRPISAENHT